VLTNYHVVEGISQVKLLLSGGRTFDARLVGTAPAFDIALLRADTAGATEADLSPLPLGDSDKLEIGQKVLAMGIHWVCTTHLPRGS
jgi:serine protease Do